jgi:hypothetical protein
LIALLTLFTGYGYVYTHTSNINFDSGILNNEIYNYTFETLLITATFVITLLSLLNFITDVTQK